MGADKDIIIGFGVSKIVETGFPRVRESLFGWPPA